MKKIIIIISAVIFSAFIALTVYHCSFIEKRYEQISAKLQESNYTLYINGVETDSSKIDIYLYPCDDISVNDEKKEVYIAICGD